MERRQVPSLMIEQRLRDYESQSRTLHERIEPPDVRLKEFERKKLIVEPDSDEWETITDSSEASPCLPEGFEDPTIIPRLTKE